jgi:hypothetical protein
MIDSTNETEERQFSDYQDDISDDEDDEDASTTQNRTNIIDELEQCYFPIFEDLGSYMIRPTNENDIDDHGVSSLTYNDCDLDTLSVSSSSLLKVIFRLAERDSSFQCKTKLNNYDVDKSSRFYIKTLSRTLSGTDDNFCPKNKRGATKPKEIRLSSFCNVILGEWCCKNGSKFDRPFVPFKYFIVKQLTVVCYTVRFEIRMYLLDDAQIPQNNSLEKKEIGSLAIMINIALENREEFEFFGTQEQDKKLEFTATFERQGGFYTIGSIEARICSAKADVARTFFRLLHATWQQIYYEYVVVANALDQPTLNGFLINQTNNQYATNEKYLPLEKETVTNDDIVKFATRCVKNSFFVANAYGFKNRINKVKSFQDICNQKSTETFTRNATILLNDEIYRVLNLTEPYPNYITRTDNIFRHDLCPVIYSVDMGHDITRFGLDEAIVPNGFACKRYIKEMLEVTREEMKAITPEDITLTGT